MTELKLGKAPATYDKRDLLMAHYVQKSKLPKPPAKFGHADLISEWGTLGNDQYGDCVWAGGAHETMLWNKEAGKDVAFTPQGVLADYGAVTGFSPQNPASDQGTNVRDALNYRRGVGLVDAGDSRHKLGAFLAIEPGDWTHLLQAVYLFSAVGIGIQFPVSAMDQFSAGKGWSVVPGNPQIEGGHYIPVVGHPSTNTVQVITWGKKITMTKSFYEKYCDEAYALLSPEMLKDGKSLEGFDLTALESDLNNL